MAVPIGCVTECMNVLLDQKGLTAVTYMPAVRSPHLSYVVNIMGTWRMNLPLVNLMDASRNLMACFDGYLVSTQCGLK